VKVGGAVWGPQRAQHGDGLVDGGDHLAGCERGAAETGDLRPESAAAEAEFKPPPESRSSVALVLASMAGGREWQVGHVGHEPQPAGLS